MAVDTEAVALSDTQSLVRGFLSKISSQQKMALILAVSAIVALAAAGWMWNRTPDYKVLFSNISDRDGGAIVATLQQMNVPYKFAEGGGAIPCLPSFRHSPFKCRDIRKGGFVYLPAMNATKPG